MTHPNQKEISRRHYEKKGKEYWKRFNRARREYQIAYRAKNKDKMYRQQRLNYQKNKVRINDQGRLKARYRHARSKKKRKAGFLYFFKGIDPGFYKVGCTTNWTNRRRNYWGPSSIKQLFFVRPVPDMYFAETQMKIFLCNHGYDQFHTTAQSDWLVRHDERVF